MIQLSTHNYFFSVSVFLMPAHNQSLILSTVPRRSGHQKCTQCSVRHAEFHSFLLFLSLFDEQHTHTHTHRSIVVYVASGQDYELNLPLSCTSLLLPSRTSDLWISQLKKRKSLYGHIVNVSGKIVMKCTLKSLFVQNGTERLFFLNSKPSPSLVKDLILKYVIICLDDLRCHLW